MDLERVGGAGLGQRFIAWYRESRARRTRVAGPALRRLRAHVRAKVACCVPARATPRPRWNGGAPRPGPRPPPPGTVTLTLVGGLPGTGKSTVAAGLADHTGWTVLRSDELRKDLAGVGHSTRGGDEYGAGLYDEASTRATYPRCWIGRAPCSSRGVGDPRRVLDPRARARRGEIGGAGHVQRNVRTARDVDPAVAAARLEARGRIGADPSDATPPSPSAWPAWPTRGPVPRGSTRVGRWSSRPRRRAAVR